MSHGYITKRLLQLLLTSFLVVSVVFFMVHLVPGDPVDLMLGDEAPETQKDLLRQQLNLHLPIPHQYTLFLTNLLQGNLGNDFLSHRSVRDLLLARIPMTLVLSFVSLIVACLISFPLGILAALKRGTYIDVVAGVSSLIGMSMPNFWLGPLLILLFSLHWGITPVSGADEPLSLLLPALTMGLSLSGFLTRMIRTSMLEVLNENYIQVARAKGLPPWLVVGKHALRNAMIPILTILGTQFGALMAGAVITESVFDWPGIGLEFFRAFQQRNYPVIQGCVIFISLSTMLVHFCVDILYWVVDPRIEYA